VFAEEYAGDGLALLVIGVAAVIGEAQPREASCAD